MKEFFEYSHERDCLTFFMTDTFMYIGPYSNWSIQTKNPLNIYCSLEFKFQENTFGKSKYQDYLRSCK